MGKVFFVLVSEGQGSMGNMWGRFCCLELQMEKADAYCAMKCDVGLK